MIRAAVQIVAARGLESLTLAECGEAAGYSRGLAAHYFGSKETLIADIATHIVAEFSRRLRDGRRGRSGLEGLLDGVTFYIESGRSNPVALRAFLAVLGSALCVPAMTQAISDLNQRSIAAFAVPIRQGMERGEIRANVDPIAHGSLIVASLRGALTQWLLDPARVDLDAILRELKESLRLSLRSA